MIEFKRVNVEGFASIQKSLNLRLDLKGVNVIFGSNGAGKTTIFNALYWCLYGDFLKAINKDNMVTRESRRVSGFRGTRVIVDFVKGDCKYRIARHLYFKGTTKKIKGGSSLLVFKKSVDADDFDIKDLIDVKHKSEIQKYINDILGMSSKAFINSVVFGQRMKRLIESDNKDKRDLFEELFEMSFIDEVKERAKDRKSITENSIKDCEHSVDNLKVRIENINKSLARGLEISNRWDEEHNRRVDEHRKYARNSLDGLKEIIKEQEAIKDKANTYDKEALDKNLKCLNEAKKAVSTTEYDLNSCENSRRRYVSELKDCENNLKKLRDEKVVDTCYVCGNRLSAKSLKDASEMLRSKIRAEEESENNLKSVIKRLDNDVEKKKSLVKKAKELLTICRKDYEKCEDSQIEAKEAYEKYRNLDYKRKTEQATYRNYVESFKSVYKEEKVIPDIANLEKDKKALELEKGKAIKEITRLSEELVRIDWWVSKAFSSGGLRAFIFSAMLNRLNTYIEKYSNISGVSIKFSVDLTKASKPFKTSCFYRGEMVDYETLSGGEKQRIDVATAFAMHDLISHSCSVNMLIMDEVFEGLDSSGIDAIYELIRDKASLGMTIFVVTHAMMLDTTLTKKIELMYDSDVESTVMV